MKTLRSFAFLAGMLTASCVSPEATQQGESFVDANLPSGRLEVGRVGCQVNRAVFTNMSSMATNYTYNTITVVSEVNETVAAIQVNCPPTAPGGSTMCLVQSTVILRPVLACQNWHSWGLQQS